MSFTRSARSRTVGLYSSASVIAFLASGPLAAQAVINDGDNVTVTSMADGETISAAAGVTSTVDGAPVVVIANNGVTLNNAGTLATTGVTQTVQVNQGTMGAVINNAETGVLLGESRVVNFDGTDATLNNDGVILGTGSQRNGAVYANRTSNNIVINNSATGSIDAGVEGAGIAIEVGGGGAPRGGSITNAGTIQGRGQASPMGGTAGDGIRFFGPGLAPEYVYEGDITNSGLINSESTQGTVAGIRFANRIGFQGTLTNEESGVISGAQNGLYFGNDADHTGGVVNNAGTISSGSRALNIDGTGLVVNNTGSILGTGNQRNGTVYADSTAQGFVLNNLETGLIDAGMGNDGAGFSVELSAEGNDFTIVNAGTIQGRGQAGAGDATAGDGLRFERSRVMGTLDGSTTGLFTGTIENSGLIASESMQGTAAGIRFVNGVSFQGELNNEEGGVISGVQNGLYFGNAVPAGGADHTGGVVNNAGIISSDSRALNIDGNGLTVNNLASGQIIGTGNQRNGTAYADGTADGFTLNNEGLIDAGEGNQGSGFAAEIGEAADGANTFTLNNSGLIQGRGNADAATGLAGDGVRIGNAGNTGVFDGTVVNAGEILSEGANGTVAGLRVVDGVSFTGTLTNEEAGLISGVQNGVYFGNADHTGGVVNNDGVILSGSRAFNIDGTGLEINNAGIIAGDGDQRNGTVYADSTAQDFVLNNTGQINVGAGNNGAGFSAELSAEGNNFTINNDGIILGDGTADAGSALAGDGLRFERERVGGMLDGTTTGLFTGTINNGEGGEIAAVGTGGGTTAGIRFVNGVSFSGEINNDGFIGGTTNGLYFGNATPAGGGDFTGAVVNNNGTIESESRALNIDGLGLTINNAGSILGAGNQRNGTVYADSTAQGFVLNNLETGLIDAGMGNDGAGFSVELSAEGNDFTIVNAGTIQGRGQADAGAATAGDGLRFERERVGGMLDGSTTGLFTGTIENSGTIASESMQGTAAGIRFVNGVSFQGTLTNSGVISGVQNGVYFGNPVPAGGADHTGGVVDNLEGGVISSDSRAFNIDGLGLTLNNAGSILGTGNQRNGTVYADGTADNFTVNNSGLIDAGEGNEGSGFGAEIGGAADGANTFDLTNSGTIQGRGQASAAVGGAGDGVRIGNVGNIGVFDGTIANSGLIASESMQGTTAGIRVVNGISFQGTLTNEMGGVIAGVQNGLYFGNPVMGEGADHTGGVVNNAGTISSGSRALNIDGIGLVVNNTGSILGTGNQRNGTVYSDITAQDFTLNNEGLIDAGMGNEGAGFSAQLASAMAGGNTFTITNSGTIQGRGDASAGAATAGDGLRFERTRNAEGMLDGTTDGLFVGTITNSGTINSEAANGTAAGIRFVNGVSFQGELNNSGTISGVQNGLYFGNPVPAGGGDFSMAVVNNAGTISSGSRALNIDGNGLTVNNLASGQIIGTGNQRNGTVYADGTADNFTFTNAGIVDAGMGNQGSGFGAEIGGAMDGANTFSLTNSGTIQGRGQAGPMDALAGDGVRIGNVGNTGVAEGNIVNSGTINSESMQGPVAGLRVVNGVDFAGSITNSGTISGGNHGIYLGAGDHSGALITNSGTLSGGVNAFFAGNALSAINFVNDGGTLIGNFVGSSAFEDTLSITGMGNSIQGNILNNVAVTTAAGSTTVIPGVRTLNGSLTHNGTLSFNLDVDRLDVIGNTVLASGSVINIATDEITAADVGRTIDVLTNTGSFANNGAVVNVAENDFLIDYNVIFGSVAIGVAATDLGDVSADANINSFGSAITSAVASNSLDAGAFAAFNALTSVNEFETASLTLLPAINEGVTREIFETQNLADAHLSDRLAQGNATGLWGALLTRTADRDADSLSVTGYDAESFGFTIGADFAAGEALRLGVSYAYADIDIDQNGAGFEVADIGASQVSAYAGYNSDNVFANGQIGYSFSNVDTLRNSVFGPVAGSFDVDGIRAQLNAGVELGSNALSLVPFVGLNYADLSSDSYSETGGLNLSAGSSEVDYLEGRIGARVATGSEDGLRLRGQAAYAYDFSGDARSFDLALSGSASPFRLQTTQGADSRFEFGAGIAFGKAEGISIGVDYQGEVASGYSSHAGVLRIRYGF